MNEEIGYRNLLLVALTVQAKAVSEYLKAPGPRPSGEFTPVPSSELDLLRQIIVRLGETAIPKRRA